METPDDSRWSTALLSAALTSDVLPDEFPRAPFLGNGGLGAFVTVDDTQLTFHVDHNASRDHQDVGGPLWGRSRFALGRLTAALPARPDAGRWHLDLETATLHLILENTGARPWTLSVISWVSAEHDRLIVRAEGDAHLTWEWVAGTPRPPREEFYPDERPSGLIANPEPVTRSEPVVRSGERTIVGTQRLHAGGGHCVVVRSRRDETVLAVAMAEEDMDHAVETASSRAAEALSDLAADEKEHRSWWRRLYRESYVELPGRYATFYWTQVYKLASATRAGRGIVTTMGPWLTSTPWAGAWWNLNVQLSYPLLARSGHEQLDSLTPALVSHVEELSRNASGHGLAIGRTSQSDLDSGAVGDPGEEGVESGNLLWALHTAWCLRSSFGDEPTIREGLLPLVREAVRYFEAALFVAADGRLHLPRTHSPELADVEDANYDLALLDWALGMLAEHLGPGESGDRYRRLRRRIVDAPTDPDEGLLIGSGRRLDISHRHYSHLLWFEPLRLWDPDDPDSRALLQRSLSHWLSRPDELRGYSRTGAASMLAQLGDGEGALSQLDTLLDGGISPTTMYRETGPVLETPLAAARSLLDLLIDDAHDRIRVFPAVPKTWPDVHFHDLRVRGGHRVSAARTDGRTSAVRIVGGAGLRAEGQIVTVDTDIPTAEARTDLGVVEVGPRGARVRVLLRAGEIIDVVACAP
jgi:alpha-L-fucosidase 2